MTIWRALLGVAAGLLFLFRAAPCRADAPEEERYKLYATLITKTLGKDFNPCNYPLHLVFMLDAAQGMHGSLHGDVKWALVKIGSNFLTPKDRLTIYNFDDKVHLEPGEAKDFKDEERFGGRLNPLFSKTKAPANDIYYRAKYALLRQANLIRENDKSHLAVAIFITHKVYGKNGDSAQGADGGFEKLYRIELQRFLKGDGEMQEAIVARKGEKDPKNPLRHDVFWAMEGGAKGKRNEVSGRYKVLLDARQTPPTPEKRSSNSILYGIALFCGGALAGCAWFVRKRLQSPIVLKTSLARAVYERSITWERREIRIYACETGAPAKSPNDVYLPTYVKEPGDALIPKRLLTLSLSEGFTGKWRLAKEHPEVFLISESRSADYSSIALPPEKKTRLYLELRNGFELEMDFTPGKQANGTLFNIGLVATANTLLLIICLAFAQQSAPPSEPPPAPTRENVCQ